MTRVQIATRAGLGLLSANLRYWTGVAPAVRSHLARWERAARAVPESATRTLALSKLEQERFNVELAATLATLADRRARGTVVQAIVALQIAYDYLDLLTETLAPPARDLRLPLSRLLHAVDVEADPNRGNAPDGRTAPNRRADADDHARGRCVYLDALVHTALRSFGRLPSARRVSPIAVRSAERCVDGQALVHGAHGDEAGEQELRRWARREAAGGSLRWQELAAGASGSVLCLHALIVAAASSATAPSDALALDRLYLSISALTMLDSLIDSEQDRDSGQRGYLARYPDALAMGQALAAVAHDALAEARSLPHRAHHAITLAGVIAYYASAPAASQPPASVVVEHIRRELRPLLLPPLAVMRAWRAAKRMRRRGAFAAVHSRASAAAGARRSQSSRVRSMSEEEEE